MAAPASRGNLPSQQRCADSVTQLLGAVRAAGRLGGNMQATVQEHRFVWDAGGWFGALFGCTVWMFVLGTTTVALDPLAGIVAFAGFAIGNGGGFALWRRRE